jgi:hypothetical protein
MKVSHFSALFVASVALLAPALSFAQEEATPATPAPAKVAVVDNYLTSKTFAQGAIFRIVLDEELPKYLAKFDEGLKKVSEQDRVDLLKQAKPDMPIPFDVRLGISQEEYDAYLACWNKRKPADIVPVVARFDKSGEPGVWSLFAVANQTPLPLSTLKYDANKDEWISSNGRLVRKEDINAPAESLMGAWSGQSWALEKSDSLTKMGEQISMGKTADGKFVYFNYAMLEVSNMGRILSRESVNIRIPVQTSKPDPLLEKAKKRAGK